MIVARRGSLFPVLPTGPLSSTIVGELPDHGIRCACIDCAAAHRGVAGILLHANAGGDKQPSLIDRIVDYLAEKKLVVPEIESVSTYTLQPVENAKPMVVLPIHCMLGQSAA